MTAIPQAIINFNNTFEGQYDTIMGVLKEIGINPPTPQQKQNLADIDERIAGGNDGGADGDIGALTPALSSSTTI